MIYDLLAPIYDQVNEGIDYSLWADFIEKVVSKYFPEGKKPQLALDLGCGTGRMAVELAKRGYDMIGVDYSIEMLNIAGRSAEECGIGERILWLCQDICEFELYGTVGLTVCCLDTINHLTSLNELKKCFSLVHNYLDPDGLFCFDINGRIKFEEIYGENTYVMEENDSFCVWENNYDPQKRWCDFYITLFKKDFDGKYLRYEEVQREKMYTTRQIFNALKKTGFEVVGAYADFDFNPGNDENERIYFVARCKKTPKEIIE